MVNPNTSEFWEKKLKEEVKLLKESPIYIKKNDTVKNYLKGFSGNLLNIGIGYGILEETLVKKYPLINFYGIDITSKFLKILKKKLKKVFIKEGSILKIPFNDNFFDGILLLDVLEHFPIQDHDKIFKEIKRVLKKGGKLIISVPINETAKDTKANRHLIKFTEKEVESMIYKKGFLIKKVHYMAAFKNMFGVKTFLNRIIKIKKSNLVLISTIKL